jgi:hypothetical protein
VLPGPSRAAGALLSTALLVGLALAVLGHPPAATSATAGEFTVTFDDRAGQDRFLNGQYPDDLIGWGADRWYLEPPFGAFATKHASLFGAGPRTARFRLLLRPLRLVSLRVYNHGPTASELVLHCDGGHARAVTLSSGEVRTVETGWAVPCAEVNVRSANGWDTHYDDLVLEALP